MASSSTAWKPVRTAWGERVGKRSFTRRMNLGFDPNSGFFRRIPQNVKEIGAVARSLFSSRYRSRLYNPVTARRKAREFGVQYHGF